MKKNTKNILRFILAFFVTLILGMILLFLLPLIIVVGLLAKVIIAVLILLFLIVQAIAFLWYLVREEDPKVTKGTSTDYSLNQTKETPHDIEK